MRLLRSPLFNVWITQESSLGGESYMEYKRIQEEMQEEKYSCPGLLVVFTFNPTLLIRKRKSHLT